MLAVGEAQGIATNRSDRAAPIDRSLGALSMMDEDGVIVGLLVDHASHATVLGHDNRQWSADWPGAARRALARALRSRSQSSGAPVVAFLQGAAGDLSPRFVRRDQSAAEVERIGGLFAAQAVAAILAADDLAEADATVTIRRRRVRIATRDLPDPAALAQRVTAAEEAWRAAVAEAGTGTPAERIARTRHEGALTAAALGRAGLPSSLELPVSVAVIGPDAWLHLPVELFSSHGAEIRARSPFRQTRIVGYADGYFGYVADTEAYRVETYEAASSLFDAGGAATLVEASVALLVETWNELWPRRNRA